MSSGPTTDPLGNHRLTLENIPAREGGPSTWGDLVGTWESYLDEKKTQNLVFVGDGRENKDEIRVAPYSHRFQQEYTEMQYAKIQDFIRGSLKEYDDPYLVFLTFSSTTLKPNGEPRPPIDHLEEVVDAWGDGVYYELNRVMEGDRKRDPWEPRPEWEYLYILEPTTDEGHVPGGYAHAHAALVVDGEVAPERFESVISKHLTACPGAKGDAHEFEDTIEVKRAEDLGNPGAYLFKYLGKSWDVTNMEDYEKRFASLIFDQERQRFRASNGAQRWLEREEEESESGEWIFAGVASDEQARELREYEDYEEFRVATEMGVRSWLNERAEWETGAVEKEEEPECRGPRMTHEEHWARERAGIPMQHEDRPPP